MIASLYPETIDPLKPATFGAYAMGSVAVVRLVRELSEPGGGP